MSPAQSISLTLFGFLTIFFAVFSNSAENERVPGNFYKTQHGLDTMKIQVGGLADGIYKYQLVADSASLELDERFIDQVVVDATIEKNGTQVFLSAQVAANASFECDRCLAPFLSPLRSSYRMCYVTEESVDSTIDPLELQLVPPGFSVIDLHDDVRQTVLLAVPFKLLCSERCKGLCPHCGTNWNLGTCDCREQTVDQRWEQLIKLKKQI